jgi:acetolactate synthase-1/2/3 large subunit
MVEMTGGQALVEQLVREGIETIFALPGVQLDGAFDALYDATDRIAVYATRHEQATAYMADGYARSTGRVGVCMVVPGPGVLNAGAALSTAYACSSPVLCVSGQIPSRLIGQDSGALHEIPNQLEMVRSFTKWSGRAMTPGEVPGIVREAFQQMRTGRPRPTEIEIPMDTLAMPGEVTLLDHVAAERSAGDPDLLKQAADALRMAERPLIYAGGGVIGSGAWDALRTLAEALNAPVIMSTEGRGALSDRHPLALNNLAGMQILPTADVILAVGTRFARPRGWGLPEGARVIRIDADEREVARAPQPGVGIVGDAKAALTALVARVDGVGPRPSRKAELDAARNVAAARLFELEPQASFTNAIRAAVPEDGILVNDVTQISFFASLGYPLYQPRTMVGPGYQGTLGSGFAIALGVQVGNPGRKVVSVNGDGGFMYNVQELATAKKYNIPLVTVVFNDNAFGNVKRIQQQSYRGRTIASDLTNPDFVALGTSFGLAAMRAETPDALEGSLKEALASNEPALIEVPAGAMPDPWPIVLRTL